MVMEAVGSAMCRSARDRLPSSTTSATPLPQGVVTRCTPESQVGGSARGGYGPGPDLVEAGEVMVPRCDSLQVSGADDARWPQGTVADSSTGGG